MIDLDPTHETIRTEWRTKIASFISGKAKPLVAEAVYIPNEICDEGSESK